MRTESDEQQEHITSATQDTYIDELAQQNESRLKDLTLQEPSDKGVQTEGR